MNNKLILILSAVYFIVLLCVPSYMIYNYYDVLNSGSEYKIKVNAYDPYDPFRGRYVAIRPVYEDVREFQNATGIENFRLERYYLNEKTAPALENRLMWQNIEENDDIYVIIKVKGDSYVIAGMYINDIAVEEYIYET